MKLFVFCLLFLAAACVHAQDKAYFSLAFSKDFPKHYHVIGGHLTANRQVAKNFYAGLGAAVNKFDHVEGFYFPVYANFSLLARGRDKNVFPIFFVQPGYGFYNRKENGITVNGGFTFHASGGISYPFIFRTQGYATLGIGHYGFNGPEGNKTSWGGRIGMMF